MWIISFLQILTYYNHGAVVNHKSSFQSSLGGDFVTICSRTHFLEFLEISSDFLTPICCNC